MVWGNVYWVGGGAVEINKYFHTFMSWKDRDFHMEMPMGALTFCMVIQWWNNFHVLDYAICEAFIHVVVLWWGVLNIVIKEVYAIEAIDLYIHVMLARRWHFWMARRMALSYDIRIIW